MSEQRSLPSRPSLEQQKKLSKDLLRAYRAGDKEAVARIRRHLPDKTRITLADAQFALAREYGFRDWAALNEHITRAEPVLGESILADFRRAFEARDTGRIRDLFARHPAAAAMIDEPLFPFDSPPLVHYAAAGDLKVVELLLEMGADPNRRSAWWAGGFHALHSAQGAVADRLLDAGARPDACAAANLDRPDLLETMLETDPARVHERGGDGQTPLHFARSREVVDLLLAHGADPDARDVDHRSTPAQWMLQARRGAGRFELARYLVDRGASVDVFLATALGLTDRLRGMLERDPSLLRLRTGRGAYGEEPPSSFHIYTWTIGQHRSPLEVAAQFEQDEALDVLRRFATPTQRFVAACAAGRADEARSLLDASPDLVERLSPDERRALPDAGWAGETAAVALMLSLGFDPAATGQDGGTVLHCAAWRGAADCVEAALRHDGVQALIERRDAVHGGTPLGWCCHGACHCGDPTADHPRVARLLLEAGARPGPDPSDAPDEVLAVIRQYGSDG